MVSPDIFSLLSNAAPTKQGFFAPVAAMLSQNADFAYKVICAMIRRVAPGGRR
jgi:hypothetical protein